MKTVSNNDYALLLAIAESYVQTPCPTTDLKGINQRRRGRLLLRKLLKNTK